MYLSDWLEGWNRAARDHEAAMEESDMCEDLDLGAEIIRIKERLERIESAIGLTHG